MQDWEYEVADANRIDEFIAAYQSGQLDDGERFTLMEVIIQSFEDIGDHLDTDPRWQTVINLLDTNIKINLLDTNIKLHASTVWYWGNPEECDPEDCWSVTASINRIWIKRRNDVMTVS